ncbi:MAG: GNAT family N-acetyltransferase [Verrucomicrobiota bacterium]
MPERGQTAGGVRPVSSPVEVERAPTPAQGRLEGSVLINPLEQPGWDGLVEARAEAWFFHGTGWARVLQETYGHVPVFAARLAGGRLRELLPLMEVSSPWTGRRGVSLPFTDFCLPLKTEGQEAGELYEMAMAEGRARGWRYLECRSSDEDWRGSSPSLVFYGHRLELGEGEEALFKKLEGPVRRGIRKAAAAGLRIQIDHTMESVETYYRLHCRTRRRHGMPPQPWRFFANIQKYMLQPGRGFVASAWWENKPVAGAVFLHQGRQALYKFGASDYAFQHVRPNNLLLWEGIRQCAARGCERLHFGRTSLANEGLRRFKLGFGTREEQIKCCKYDFRAGRFVRDVDRAEGWSNRVFALLPPRVLRLAGQLLYPHLS